MFSLALIVMFSGRTCRLVIVPSYGGVADIGLSCYSPVRRRAATIVSDLKNVDQQISRIHSGTAGYMNCSPQSQAD